MKYVSQNDPNLTQFIAKILSGYNLTCVGPTRVISVIRLNIIEYFGKRVNP
jgi:hypothetical protein